MRIAVIGSAGQLGSALTDVLSEEIVPLTRADVDLADAAAVNAALDAAAADVVINAAAYNFVDRAEDEPRAAFAVNALGPRNLAAACRRRDLLLVHVSTDYVFGLDAARDTPYVETDAPGPLSVYAVGKLAGEYFVRSLCPRHFVVRTCGLYGTPGAAGKGNFVKTMLRLAGERKDLRVINDQHCTPTSCADLAEWISKLIQTDRYGLYHATNSGGTTWFDFAREIVRLAKADVNVVPITTAEYAAAARRPAYSVLDCGKLARVIGRAPRPWEEALADYVRVMLKT